MNGLLFDHEMNTLRHALAMIVLVLTTANSSHAQKSSSYVIVPGLGITNVVALGMSIKGINTMNRDLYYFTDRKWMFWKQPTWQTGVIPSFGISFSGPFNNSGIVDDATVSFYVGPSSRTSLRRFEGSLSCGISFSNTSIVSKEMLTHEFGVPKEQFLMGTKIAGITLPESHCVVIPDLGMEKLYYPQRGISFDLQSNRVIRVTIFPTNWVEPSGRGYGSPGAGEPYPHR